MSCLYLYRLIDLTTRHRAETEMETERLRSAQIQAERTLEARERSHRQRVKGLEEQVATLKDQLGQEIRKRQAYIRSVALYNCLCMGLLMLILFIIIFHRSNLLLQFDIMKAQNHLFILLRT